MPDRVEDILGGAAEGRVAALPEVLVRAERLSLSAGGTALVRDLSFDVRAGRRTVIVGANGAGKSVTLRLLHGLRKPDSGRVIWQGRPLDRRARRAQAMVFQSPVLLRRSVRDNLAFALAAASVPRRDRRTRIEAALAGAQLGHLADRPARSLSGGEQQRVAIARALLCRPRLLLLDEPTASLDPAATRDIEAQILTASQTGITVVLVTHDAGQARRLADDIVFLHSGRVAERGAAARVLDDPRSEPARAWLEGRIYTGP